MAFPRNTSVYQYLLDVKKQHGTGFFVLLDPDRSTVESTADQARRCEDTGVDAILVGSSLLMANSFDRYLEAAQRNVSIPVIIFPGEKSHVSDKADAILFLSLLSGRNPDLIIGEQIRSAPLIKSIGLEAISTAYLLVDSGRLTSVEYMSNTKPIPSDKPEIAVAHAMAAEIFGMKFVYLEAGSGAERPVPDDMVCAVSSRITIPVIVGGGIRNPETVARKALAGASFIVVGNHLEKTTNYSDLESFVRAAHS